MPSGEPATRVMSPNHILVRQDIDHRGLAPANWLQLAQRCTTLRESPISNKIAAMRSRFQFVPVLVLFLSLVAMPAYAQSDPVTHVVQAGENLFRIALWSERRAGRSGEWYRGRASHYSGSEIDHPHRGRGCAACVGRQHA